MAQYISGSTVVADDACKLLTFCIVYNWSISLSPGNTG